jgi:hypothetical protein
MGLQSSVMKMTWKGKDCVSCVENSRSSSSYLYMLIYFSVQVQHLVLLVVRGERDELLIGYEESNRVIYIRIVRKRGKGRLENIYVES